MNYLSGISETSLSQDLNDFTGKTCPLPGRLPHGDWTCEMQEIPIHGISSLVGDAQTYPGKKENKYSYQFYKMIVQPFNAD